MSQWDDHSSRSVRAGSIRKIRKLGTNTAGIATMKMAVTAVVHVTKYLHTELVQTGHQLASCRINTIGDSDEKARQLKIP